MYRASCWWYWKSVQRSVWLNYSKGHFQGRKGQVWPIFTYLYYSVVTKFCPMLLHHVASLVWNESWPKIWKVWSYCAEVNNKQPKEFTLSIFCDLSKAFDVINHDILIKKLEYYGFRGVVLGWLKNYLSDRFQYVEIENEKSTQCSISCGVPQGSILGPLLYLIYVNDIDKSTMRNILSFADDTSLFISDTDPSNLFRTSNIEIQNLYNWFVPTGYL